MAKIAAAASPCRGASRGSDLIDPKVLKDIADKIRRRAQLLEWYAKVSLLAVLFALELGVVLVVQLPKKSF